MRICSLAKTGSAARMAAPWNPDLTTPLCPSGKYQEIGGQPYCETCGEGFVCDHIDAATSGAATSAGAAQIQRRNAMLL